MLEEEWQPEMMWQSRFRCQFLSNGWFSHSRESSYPENITGGIKVITPLINFQHYILPHAFHAFGHWVATYRAMRFEFVKPLVIFYGLYSTSVGNSLLGIYTKTCPSLPVASPRFLLPGQIHPNWIVAQNDWIIWWACQCFPDWSEITGSQGLSGL